MSATSRRIAQSMVRELDLFSDQVVEVMDVTAGGVAKRSGIRNGDLIVAINDRITASVDDVHRLLTLIPQDSAMEITLIRGETKMDIRVAWDQ